MRKDGKIDYIEFPGSDLPAAKRFYGEAFGWIFTDYGPDYVAFEGEGVDGGFTSIGPEAPEKPLVILYAHDLEAMEARVRGAGGAHPGFHRLEIMGVEDDQRLFRRLRSDRGETAIDAFAFDGHIVRPVVGENPAERLAVEPLGGRKVAARELDIVDLAVLAHGRVSWRLFLLRSSPAATRNQAADAALRTET